MRPKICMICISEKKREILRVEKKILRERFIKEKKYWEKVSWGTDLLREIYPEKQKISSVVFWESDTKWYICGSNPPGTEGKKIIEERFIEGKLL